MSTEHFPQDWIDGDAELSRGEVVSLAWDANSTVNTLAIIAGANLGAFNSYRAQAKETDENGQVESYLVLAAQSAPIISGIEVPAMPLWFTNVSLEKRVAIFGTHERASKVYRRDSISINPLAKSPIAVRRSHHIRKGQLNRLVRPTTDQETGVLKAQDNYQRARLTKSDRLLIRSIFEGVKMRPGLQSLEMVAWPLADNSSNSEIE